MRFLGSGSLIHASTHSLQLVFHYLRSQVAHVQPDALGYPHLSPSFLYFILLKLPELILTGLQVMVTCALVISVWQDLVTIGPLSTILEQQQGKCLVASQRA